MVEARAGSAKTSTIRAALRMIPRRDSARVVVITFNRENSADLHSKGVFQATTCHALGRNILKAIDRTSEAAWNIQKGKTDRILDALYPPEEASFSTGMKKSKKARRHPMVRALGAFVRNLVERAKDAGIGCAGCSPNTLRSFEAIVKKHGLVYHLETSYERIARLRDTHVSYTVAERHEAGVRLARRVLEVSSALVVGGGGVPEGLEPMIDFGDMLYAPVLLCGGDGPEVWLREPTPRGLLYLVFAGT
jgi:hypothetical protein